MHTFETTVFQINHFMPPYGLNGDLRVTQYTQCHAHWKWSCKTWNSNINCLAKWRQLNLSAKSCFLKTNLSIRLVLQLHGHNVARGLEKESGSIFSSSQPATKHSINTFSHGNTVTQRFRHLFLPIPAREQKPAGRTYKQLTIMQHADESCNNINSTTY